LVGNRVVEARVEPMVGNGSFSVTVLDRTVELKVIDRKRHSRVGDHSVEGRVEIVARMPGKVVRILAERNSLIRAGEGVLVVEAMKMQNEVKSPKDGRLLEIRVRDGQTVISGEVLAVIE
jgi:biotin carboxyl carrier protein